MKQNVAVGSLIVSNLVPVFGVLFFGWNASMILFLYWMENVVIGVYNLLKISMVRMPATSTGTVNGRTVPADKKFIMPFFLVHYGMFTFVHGVFLFSMFIKDLSVTSSLVLAILSLFVSHGVSFLTNFVGGKEYERTAPEKLMFAPYKRIVIMHMTIIFSAAITMATGQSIMSLLVLVGLKTTVDLFSHTFEHIGEKTYVFRPTTLARRLLESNKLFIRSLTEKSLEKSITSGSFEEMSGSMDPEVSLHGRHLDCFAS